MSRLGGADAFLIVYSVLWGAVTPSFSRLRVFTTSRLFASEWRKKTARRLMAGLLVANLLAIATLAFGWLVLDGTSGVRAIVGGAVAGLSVTSLPRLLHSLVASNQTWCWFYDGDEWRAMMDRWEPGWRADGDWLEMNTLSSHLVPGLIYLVVPLGLGSLIASFG